MLIKRYKVSGPVSGVMVKVLNPTRQTLWFESWTWLLERHTRHMYVHAQGSDRRMEEKVI